MIKLFRPCRKASLLARLLWLGVGLFAFWPLSMAVLESPTGVFSDSRSLVSAFFAALFSAGWFLKWGTTIPCLFVGMAMFAMMTDPVTSSLAESFQVDFVVPLTGAALGAAIGLMLDLNPGTSQSQTPNADGPGQPVL